MTRGEVRVLLLEASAFDGKQVTETVVNAWHQILRNTDAGQAMAAMREHFSTSPYPLMPAHVMAGVKALRAELMRDFNDAGQAAEIPDADPDDSAAYILAVREQRTRAGDGADMRPRPVRAMLESSQGLAIGAMPSGIRETTAKVVPCGRCQALVGRSCTVRSMSGKKRSPHPERMAAFEEWKVQRYV